MTRSADGLDGDDLFRLRPFPQGNGPRRRGNYGVSPSVPLVYAVAMRNTFKRGKNGGMRR
jgi:hypothetical protein